MRDCRQGLQGCGSCVGFHVFAWVSGAADRKHPDRQVVQKAGTPGYGNVSLNPPTPAAAQRDTQHGPRVHQVPADRLF